MEDVEDFIDMKEEVQPVSSAASGTGYQRITSESSDGEGEHGSGTEEADDDHTPVGSSVFPRHKESLQQPGVREEQEAFIPQESMRLLSPEPAWKRTPPPPPTMNMTVVQQRHRPPPPKSKLANTSTVLVDTESTEEHSTTTSESEGEQIVMRETDHLLISPSASYGAGGAGRRVRSNMDQVLGGVKEADRDYWLEAGLSEQAANNLVSLDRLMGSRKFSAQTTNEEAARYLNGLFEIVQERDFKTYDEKVWHVRTRIEESTRFTIDVIGTEQIKSPAQRELGHFTASRNEKLPPDESTSGSLNPAHRAFFLDLDFLHKKIVNYLEIKTVPGIPNYEFANCLCPILRMQNVFGVSMSGRQLCSLVLNDVILESRFIQALQGVPTLVTLVMERCLVLDTVVIEKMDKLSTLVSGLVPVANGIEIIVDWQSLPSLVTLVINANHDMVYKDYNVRPRAEDLDESMESRVYVKPCSVRFYKFLNHETVRLKRLYLNFPHSDWEHLSGQVALDADDLDQRGLEEVKKKKAVAPVFGFLSVKKLMLECGMAKAMPNIYLTQPGDIVMHVYNPDSLNIRTYQIMNRSTGKEASDTTYNFAHIELLNHGARSVLNLTSVMFIWAQLIRLQVKVLSLGSNSTISLGLAHYFRVLKDNVSMEGQQVVSQMTEIQRMKVEEVMQNKLRAEILGGGKDSKVVKAPADSLTRLVLALWGRDNPKMRIPVIILAISPLMHRTVMNVFDFSDMDTFLYRQPFEAIDAMIRGTHVLSAQGEPQPKVTHYAKDSTSFAEVKVVPRDFVAIRDERMPFSNPDVPSLEFPMTYAIMVWPKASVYLPNGAEVFTSSEHDTVQNCIKEMTNAVGLATREMVSVKKKANGGICGPENKCVLF